jgi:hypothetical protein
MARLKMFSRADKKAMKKLREETQPYGITIHEYSSEGANGEIVWVRYNPKEYTPETDTRTRAI